MLSLYLRTNGGYIKNTKLNGNAEKYSYITSSIWIGNFICNKLNGIGKKISYNENFYEIFIGNFINDLQDGQHIYYSFTEYLHNGLNTINVEKKYVLCNDGQITEIFSTESSQLIIEIERANYNITKFHIKSQ